MGLVKRTKKKVLRKGKAKEYGSLCRSVDK